jgi:putative phage-type endonuclease
MIQQGTPEWFASRLGKVTASRIADVMAAVTTAANEGYMIDLAWERITGEREPSFVNAAMQWGTDTEPKALYAYEVFTGFLVETVAMIDHPTILMSGASPDGLADLDGQIEIKCPNTSTHARTLLTGKYDPKYAKQMQWQMACTGRTWCDFVSFDPRSPEHLQLCIIRVPRDEEVIAKMEAQVTTFLLSVAAMVEKFTETKAAA